MLGKFLRYHDPNLSLKYCNPQVPALLSGLVYPDSFLSVLIIQAQFLFSFYLLSVSIRALRFHSHSSISYRLSSGHLICSPLQMISLNTTPEPTPSRSSHLTSPFTISLLSVTAVLLPTQIQTGKLMFMLQSPAHLQCNVI